MIEYDEFGPEKILSVYDAPTGMRGIVVIDNTALGPGKGGVAQVVITVDELIPEPDRTAGGNLAAELEVPGLLLDGSLGSGE